MVAVWITWGVTAYAGTTGRLVALPDVPPDVPDAAWATGAGEPLATAPATFPGETVVGTAATKPPDGEATDWFGILAVVLEGDAPELPAMR
jgi:hypothetical protein